MTALNSPARHQVHRPTDQSAQFIAQGDDVPTPAGIVRERIEEIQVAFRAEILAHGRPEKFELHDLLTTAETRNRLVWQFDPRQLETGGFVHGCTIVAVAGSTKWNAR